MTFSIIGTGNIAWFFGSRIVTARHHCVGVYGRDQDAAKSLASALLSDKYGPISEMEDGEADICFIAVSDGAIPVVAASLSLKHTILVHTAGAVSIDAIGAAATDRAVLWPVYSILKTSQPGHRNIPCAWEASTDKARKVLLAMSHAITDELFEASYEQRKWLHVSAVMSNNFITHLLAICGQICTENNLPLSTLLPIIYQTFDRVKHSASYTVQTGPAIRNDTSTIQEHLALLEKNDGWQRIYSAITDSIRTTGQDSLL